MANSQWYNNVLTKTFGGTMSQEYVADPLVKGYGFIYLDLPQFLTANDNSIMWKLAATAKGVSGLNINLDTESIDGLGGVRFSIPTKLTMPTTFTIDYMEITDPSDAHPIVFNLHKEWIYTLRDFRYGASNLKGPSNYTKSNYSGILYVWITLPDANTIVDAYVLTGVVPTSLPIDSIGLNINDNGKADISIEYTFDNLYWLHGNPSYGSNGYSDNSSISSAFSSYFSQIQSVMSTFSGMSISSI